MHLIDTFDDDDVMKRYMHTRSRLINIKAILPDMHTQKYNGGYVKRKGMWLCTGDRNTYSHARHRVDPILSLSLLHIRTEMKFPRSTCLSTT